MSLPWLYHTPSTSLPVLGVLPEFMRRRRDLHNVLARYCDEARAAGKPLVTLDLGPFRRMALVADADVAGQVMRHHEFANRTSFPIIDAIYSQLISADQTHANMGGVTFVNAEPWRRNRLAAQRCLSRPSFLAQARRVTASCADRLIDSWRARGLVNSGAPVDLGREMSRLAIDVMGHLCWNKDLGAIAGDLDQFFIPVHRMLDAIQTYIYTPLPASVLTWLPTPTLRRLRGALRQLRATGHALMAARFDAAARGPCDDAHDDVLTFLLHELLTDAASKDDLDNVQATLMDLLGAGHDTTANALAFCLGLLAQPAHADWQERAAQEAQAAEAKYRPIMAAAYRETLRLYPLGAVFSRVAGADATLRFGAGQDIPVKKDAQMLISPYAMGRDASAWRDATQFQPERHLTCPWCAAPSPSPRLTLPQQAAYAPYGAGKRACVGAHFAELEASVALSRILRAFRLRLLQGDAAIEADLLFTMRPRQPLLAHVEAR